MYGFDISPGIYAGGVDGVAVKRVGAGGAFLLPESLYQTGVFHHVDGSVVVLCSVADVKPPNAEFFAGERPFHSQAVVCGDFGGLSFGGQLAFSQPPRSADVVWSVH